MKISTLVLASVASAVAVASGHPEAVNASTPWIGVASNSSHEDIAPLEACELPRNHQQPWWYNSRSNGPHRCYGSGEFLLWSMLKSYRSGGTENVHWKYTDDPRDSECLVDWDYYDEDGTSIFATIKGRTTLAHDTRRWCALPVYRSGGVKGTQWEYCHCPNIG